MSFNMTKFMTIATHEYSSRVRTKAFAITTILGPLILLAVILIPVVVSMLTSNSTEKRIAVLDKTGMLVNQVVQSDTAKFVKTDESEAVLKSKVLSEDIDAFLELPPDFIKTGKATLYTRGGGGFGMLSVVNNAVSDVLRKYRLIKSGADTTLINYVESRADIQTQKITKKGTEKDFTEAYIFMGYILAMVIYMMMLFYGTFVMRGVIEEKANRIIEVIASSAKPFEIMMGKIIGIGCVGLTQVLIWVIFGFIISTFGVSILGSMLSHNIAGNMGMQNNAQIIKEIPPFSAWLAVAFVFFTLAGYFVYATLFAAVASAVDQESDVQQLQWPVMIPIILPILLISAVLADPDSTFSVVLSLIPFFAPILMMVRIAGTAVPIWQIALCVVLLIGTFFVNVWGASRIYRVGILMYGKRPKLSEILKWIRIS